jgi:hypothetical protein
MLSHNRRDDVLHRLDRLRGVAGHYIEIPAYHHRQQEAEHQHAQWRRTQDAAGEGGFRAGRSRHVNNSGAVSHRSMVL